MVMANATPQSALFFKIRSKVMPFFSSIL